MYKTLTVLNLLPLLGLCTVQVPTVTFNNGIKVPILGMGTFRSKPSEVGQAVRDAIDVGYRHIDCAYIYGNEKEVGEAISDKIAKGVVKREDLFITSKLWNSFHNPKQVEDALKITLQNLGLDYLDLYLIHWPMGNKENDLEFTDDDYVDTWLAMEKLYEKKLVKSIGISNFNKAQIGRVLERATVIPVTNQVECHPYLNQQKLLDYCKSNNITITAHTPLGSAMAVPEKPDAPILFENPKIKAIADKLHKTPAQILIRYQIQRGVIVIPKSVHKNRIQENFDVTDFQISDEDMAIINGLDINGRIVKIFPFKTHKYFPFNDEY